MNVDVAQDDDTETEQAGGAVTGTGAGIDAPVDDGNGNVFGNRWISTKHGSSVI